jgi:23S rRNA (adenine2030-N6)-methyltransferase
MNAHLCFLSLVSDVCSFFFSSMEVFMILLKETLRVHEEGIMLVDTHAGHGCYTISSAETGSTCAEYSKGAASGIKKVMEQRDQALPPPIEEYINLLERHEKEGNVVTDENETSASTCRLRLYPGSPKVSKMLLRPQDDHVMFELNPSYYDTLKELFHDSDAKIHCSDGFLAATNVNKGESSKHGFYLIDPPYEHPEECSGLLLLVKKILEMDHKATIMLWIPLFEETLRPEVKRMEQELLELVVENDPLSASIQVSKTGMIGSCVFLVNPPPNMRVEQHHMATTLSWMADCLEQEPGCGSYNLSSSSQ